MILLVLGVALWWAAHLFKRVAPNLRARTGNAGKGGVALVVLVSIVLMVIGYRTVESVPLWHLGNAGLGVNNLLMVLAVPLMGLGDSKSRLRGKIRHPMLLGMIVWVVAHLLVNGDLESVVLFGGLGVWAIAHIWAINRSEPKPAPFEGGSLYGDIRLVTISAVMLIAIVGVHMWFGLAPFPM